MAFLPLLFACQAYQGGGMNSTTVRLPAGAIRRLVNRVGQVVAECNEATRRLTTLAGTPDRYPADPERAPDTYAEFLIRTAGLTPRKRDGGIRASG
jgi:hypothetical protein